MKTRIFFAAVFAAVCAFSFSASAEVNWRLQLGGMSTLNSYRPAHESTSRKFTLLLGAELQIPVKNNWFVETGANFRFGSEAFTYEHLLNSDPHIMDIPFKDFDENGRYIGPLTGGEHKVYSNTNGFIEIPVRAGWKLVFDDENEMQFSFGPYMSFALESDYLGIKGRNCFSVGLTPAVVYKHRALSLGLFYQNPCIYNGPKNRDTNTLMITIGVNFGGHSVDMDKVISGLEIASGVLGAATTVAEAYVNSQNNSNYSASGSSESRRNDGGSSVSRSSENEGNGFSSSKRTARNVEKKAYDDYVKIVINILSGDDTTNNKRDIQQKMRQIREKWDAKGDGWAASPYETK